MKISMKMERMTIIIMKREKPIKSRTRLDGDHEED